MHEGLWSLCPREYRSEMNLWGYDRISFFCRGGATSLWLHELLAVAVHDQSVAWVIIQRHPHPQGPRIQIFVNTQSRSISWTRLSARWTDVLVGCLVLNVEWVRLFGIIRLKLKRAIFIGNFLWPQRLHYHIGFVIHLLSLQEHLRELLGSLKFASHWRLILQIRSLEVPDTANCC